MGIKDLTKVIQENAPGAIRNTRVADYYGKKIAIDASVSLYQILTAEENIGNPESHIVGIFDRTVKMVENGIKPVYVFDGEPPELKANELEKRKERRDEAQAALEKAEEDGNFDNIIKMKRRLVKVTQDHVKEVKILLKFMGIPFVDAPGEAEATCAELVKDGMVYAVGTEDMDALAFGATVVLRNLAGSGQNPVMEYNLLNILKG